MFDYGHGIIGYVLTSFSVILGSFASIISLIVVIMIIYHQYHNRLKREEKITLTLSANIYSLLFIYLLTLVSANIQTLIGDVYGNNFDSSWCTFRAYFSIAMFCSAYHVFVTQASFRLCRIVYPNYRRLQLYWFYITVAPIQIVAVFILLCPVLIWEDITYLSDEHYCFPRFIKIRSILLILFTGYGFPLFSLAIIYTRIVVFIRQHANNLTLAVRRRQERDLLAIQRIFINFGILIALGIPAVVVIFMCFINGVEHPLAYRIMWFGVEVSMAVLSVEMAIMTPQLKNIVVRRWRQNHVIPMEGSIQLRMRTTVQ